MSDTQADFWITVAVFAIPFLAFAFGFWGFPRLGSSRKNKKVPPERDSFADGGILTYTGDHHSSADSADGGDGGGHG